MANQRISDLPQIAGITNATAFPVVDDVAGVPTTLQASALQIANHVAGVVSVVASGGATVVAPDYANSGGAGNRTASIAVTCTSGMLNAADGNDPTKLVNGVTSGAGQYANFVSQAVAGKKFRFEWPSSAHKVVTEAKIYVQGSGTQGVWQWYGVRADGTRLAIGSTFSLAMGTSPLVVTTLAANVEGFRAYEMEGVSGNTTAGSLLFEVEFKIGSDTKDGHAYLPRSASAGLMLYSGSDNTIPAWGAPPTFAETNAAAHELRQALEASDELNLDLYASSAGPGSDANDGVTSAQPKATLSAVVALASSTSKIGLLNGSVWRDKWMTPVSKLRGVRTIGSNAPPCIDCTDVISSGSFTASAHADAGGVVYEVTLSRDSGSTYGGDDVYQMFENGAYLARVASVALCASTPGSIHIPQPYMQSTPSLCYVHPFGNTDPRSDGKIYTYSRRPAAIYLYDTDHVTVEGLWLRGGGGSIGSLGLRRDSVVRRVLIGQGSKHHLVVRGGSLEDVICFDSDLTNPAGGNIPFTMYDPNPTNRDFIARRCGIIMPTGRTRGSAGAFYCHGSGDDNWRHTTFDGWITVGGGCLGPLAMGEQRFLNLLGLDASCVVGASNQGTLVDIRRALVQHTVFSGNRPALDLDNSPGAATGQTGEWRDNQILIESGTGSAITIGISTAINVHHNTIVSVSQNSPVSIAAGSSGLTFSRNIVAVQYPSDPGPNYISLKPGITADFNVYINLNNKAFQYWNYNNTNYSSFSAYQSASGLEANSVVLNQAQANQLFLGGVTGLLAGDFRLNPACTLTFGDGSLIVANAGCQSYYDWTRRGVVSGQSPRWPTVPRTEAALARYVNDPWGSGEIYH